MKISSETEKRIIKMYMNGISMCRIAKELSVSSGTVYLHLRKAIPKEERQSRQHVASFDEEQAKIFCDLYKNGMSSVQIGNRFGIGSDVVLYALKKSGIDTSKGGKYNSKVGPEDLLKMIKIYKKTGSVLDTANRMGLHPSSVHNRLSNEGIIKRKALNQKMVKEKYDRLTRILKALFNKMGIDLEYAQEVYNGPGPDMIVRKGKRRILVEHKATVKRSFYWKHAIEEARKNGKALGITRFWVITTAKKPSEFKEIPGFDMTFYDDLEKLLVSNGLTKMVDDIRFISNTPSV